MIRFNPLRTSLAVQMAAVLAVILFSVLGVLMIFQFSVFEKHLKRIVGDKVASQTEVSHQLAQASLARVAIYRAAEDSIVRQHLIDLAESLIQVCRMAYDGEVDGLASRQEMQRRAGRAMLLTSIGRSGYPFAWDVSQAPQRVILAVHPKIQGGDVTRFDFVHKAVEMRTGYLEYMWANPGEPEPRAKAMGLAYFAPWDWVIAASAYRDEFHYLLDQSFYASNTQRLVDEIARGKFGNRGFSWAVDTSGNVMVPPDDPELVLALDLPLARMIEQQSGVMYQERSGQELVVAFRYFEPQGWILLSTAYLSDYLDAPMSLVRRTGLAVGVLLVVFLGSVLLWWLSARILRPVARAAEVAKRIADGHLDNEPLARPGQDEVARLARAIDDMAVEIRDYLDRLTASERRYRTLFQNSPESILTLDMEGRILDANPASTELSGYGLSELKGMAYTDLIIKEDHHEVAKAFAAMYARGMPVRSLSGKVRTRQGSLKNVAGTAAVRRDSSGLTIGSQATFRDVTRARQLEEQLLQSQKMDSLGTLAGGIAHDFNNLLSGILGYTSLILSSDLEDDRLRNRVETIDRSAQRAAELTQRLLAFSRSGAATDGPVEVNRIAQEVVDIISRTIDRSITVGADLAEGLPVIRGEAGQIHQALLNLCINARDAMPEGGEITVSSGPADIKPGDKASKQAPAGEYVVLEVADTGAGIPTGVQTSMFDPFFTTKPEGQGTGLGLSVVYGVARRHQGAIVVDSAPGRGTRFRLYLPARVYDGPGPDEDRPGDQTRPREGVVLVADDEPVVLEVVNEVLTERGLKVLTAHDGREALDIMTGQGEDIDLVILDLIMPHLNGPDTFRTMRRKHPLLPIIISSGFSSDDRIEDMVSDEHTVFLPKPYRASRLVEVVDSLLGDDGATGETGRKKG